MRVTSVAALLLLLSLAAAAAPVDARRIFQEAEKAEHAGDAVRAYLLYSQAVALDPYNLEYLRRREMTRTRAALQPGQRQAQGEPRPAPERRPPEPQQEALPPVELKALPGRMDLELRGDARELFTQVARAYKLEVLFDSDYQAGSAIPFRATRADYREALHSLEAATGSFVIPVGERLIMVARDTTPKRAELEPVVSVTIPVSAAFTAQDGQEVVRAAQQVLALARIAYDAQRGEILLRDRVSRVRPAQILIQRLLQNRTMVAIELEFVEMASGSSTSYGASLQTLFPLASFGQIWNSTPFVPAGFTRFLTFGGGRGLVGLGLADAQVFARMSESSGHTLFRSEVRSLDGQQVTVHVGDRYPVVMGKIQSTDQADQLLLPPMINFEELGFSLQLTPRANGAEDVTLELSAEFKALTGQIVDELPVIANRKLQASVRLRSGEWAVIAGLMNSTQGRTVSGLAGFSRIPLVRGLLRSNTRDQNTDEVLVVLKPTVLGAPSREGESEALWVGPEPRPRLPL